jgi:hypothetical protein
MRISFPESSSKARCIQSWPQTGHSAFAMMNLYTSKPCHLALLTVPRGNLKRDDAENKRLTGASHIHWKTPRTLFLLGHFINVWRCLGAQEAVGVLSVRADGFANFF